MTYHAQCLMRRAWFICALGQCRRPGIFSPSPSFRVWPDRLNTSHYVLIFAWSLIAYGFGAQWMRFAYFGVYHPGRFGEYVGSLAGLLLIGVTAVALVLTALGVFGFFEPSFLFAVFALVCGMTIYEAAFEVARTLLL